LVQDTELTFGQKAHLTQRVVKTLLKNTNWLLGIAIAVFILILVVGLPSVQFLQSFSIENRLNSEDGPICNPDYYLDPNDYPAQIFVVPNTGAEKAGLKDGDIIIGINDLVGYQANLIRGWADKLPDVKPGDFVEVRFSRNTLEQTFTVETIPSEGDPSRPMIGFIIPDSPTCALYFILNEGVEFTQGYLALVIGALWVIVIISGIAGSVFILIYWKFRPVFKNITSEIGELENEYLDQNYVLTFGTMSASGKTNGEKIFNLAQNVFPELRKESGKPQKWKGVKKDSEGYTFDCYQTTADTDSELFIVKHFGDEKITLDKIQELCDKALNSRKDEKIKKKIDEVEDMPISRIICVGKNYDTKLLESDEYLSKVMLDKLEFDSKIDLILEKDGKYSVIWIDYE